MSKDIYDRAGQFEAEKEEQRKVLIVYFFYLELREIKVMETFLFKRDGRTDHRGKTQVLNTTIRLFLLHFFDHLAWQHFRSVPPADGGGRGRLGHRLALLLLHHVRHFTLSSSPSGVPREKGGRNPSPHIFAHDTGGRKEGGGGGGIPRSPLMLFFIPPYVGSLSCRYIRRVSSTIFTSLV